MGFTGLPVIHKWRGQKLLIHSTSPLCRLSKHRQKSSTGLEELCILISLFPFVLRTQFLSIPLSPTALPEGCLVVGQRGKLGLKYWGPATGRCWAASLWVTLVWAPLHPPAPSLQTGNLETEGPPHMDIWPRWWFWCGCKGTKSSSTWQFPAQLPSGV